ncbi:MAG: M48 family metalloprotease [bacterium]
MKSFLGPALMAAALCCLLISWAAAESTHPSRIGVFFLNAEGKYDKALQEEWQTELSRPALIKQDIDYRLPADILNPKIVQETKKEQQETLLCFPDLLFNSSYARELFGVDHLLVVNVTRKGSSYLLSASLGEIGTDKWGYLTARNSRKDAAMEQLGSEVRKALHPETPKIKVLLNLDSKLYHKEKCDHISPGARVEICESIQEAVAGGYRPCPICFPENNPLLKQDELETALSREMSGAIEYSYRISGDQESIERVRRIGSRIVDANRLNDLNFNFFFNVLDSDEINAFSAGGPIYVTEGLLRVLESDDELAGVISHEIGHVTNHHAIRQYRQGQNLDFLGVIVGIATRSNIGMIMSDFIGTLISRGYDRNFELEADEDALILTSVAGYRPEELIVSFKKLEDLGKQMPSNTPSWLSTHPEMAKRIEESKKMLDKLNAFTHVVKDIGAVDETLAGYIRSHPYRYLTRLEALQAFENAFTALPLKPKEPSGPASPKE